MLTKRALLAAILLLVLLQPANAQSSQAEALVELITARLAVMKEVAAFKHANDLAVEDKSREAVVLAKARDQAEAEGLNGPSVLPFFQRQMNAAKAIQACWIGRWKAGDAKAPRFPRDLQSEIRPQLITIGAQINATLAAALAESGPLSAEQLVGLRPILALDCLSQAEGDAVLQSLTLVRRSAGTEAAAGE